MDSQHAVAAMLGVGQDAVFDATQLAGGKDRFQFFTAARAGAIVTVIKTSPTDDLRDALRREANAYDLLRMLGIPTLGLTTLTNGETYAEAGEVGMIAMNYLPATEWYTFNSVPAVCSLDEAASRRLGVALAQVVSELSGCRIPESANRQLLLHPAGIAPQFRAIDTIVLRMTRIFGFVASRLPELFPDDHKERFETLAREVAKCLCFLTMLKPDGGLYLYHGDLAPSNVALMRRPIAGMEDWCVFDLEYASASPFQALAMICDRANAFARCWCKPILQETYVRELVRASLTADRPIRPILHAMIVMGTLGLAQYRITDPASPEFDMARNLLTCFPKYLEMVTK